METIKKRQSLRIFDKREITEEDKRLIFEAAVSAPTAGALMLYSIIQIEDESLKESLSKSCDNQPFIATAPLVLVFAADYQRYWDNWEKNGKKTERMPGTGDLMLACCDALIAAQTAVIAAESAGIGSCYIGDILENAEKHKEILKLPRYVFPVTMLCLGYKPEGFERKVTERLPVSEILHKNGYETKYAEKTEHSEKLYEKAFRKFNSEFSSEMTRSVNKWLENWKC